MPLQEIRPGNFNLRYRKPQRGDPLYVAMAGVWKMKREGSFGDGYWQASSGAIQAIDEYWTTFDRVNGDADLSGSGKEKQLAQAAKLAIEHLAPMGRRAANVTAILRRELRELPAVDPYKPGDVASVLQDLAIVGLYRQASLEQKQVYNSQADPAMVSALLRMPPVLSGADDNVLTRLRESASIKRDPLEHERRAELAEHEALTVRVLDDVLHTIASHANLGILQVREILGADAEHFNTATYRDASFQDRRATPEETKKRDEERELDAAKIRYAQGTATDRDKDLLRIAGAIDSAAA